MYKLLLLSGFIFSGCSYFTFNATMCNEIASDPHATVPEACRAYNEKQAEEAFDKADKKPTDISEIIEFNKILDSNTSSQSKDSDIIEFNKE